MTAFQPIAEHPRCPCCGQQIPALPRIDETATACALVGLEKRIFYILAAARGTFLTQHQLISILWDGDAEGGPENAGNVLRITILKLRAKLESYAVGIETRQSRYCQNIRLIGRWKAVNRHCYGYTLERAAA